MTFECFLPFPLCPICKQGPEDAILPLGSHLWTPHLSTSNQQAEDAGRKIWGQQPRAGAVSSDQTPGGELPPPSHHPAAQREIPARFGAGDPTAQHRVPELGLGAFTWALRRAREHQVCAAAKAQSLCCHQPRQSQDSFSWVSH